MRRDWCAGQSNKSLLHDQCKSGQMYEGFSAPVQKTIFTCFKPSNLNISVTRQLFAVPRRALGGLTGHCVTQEGADWTGQLNPLSHDSDTNTDKNTDKNTKKGADLTRQLHPPSHDHIFHLNHVS